MKPMSRELCSISAALENAWIDRIHSLEEEGMTCGDEEYDAACANLCAVADEFWIWEKD